MLHDYFIFQSFFLFCRIHDAVDLIKLYSIVHSVAAKSDGISLLKVKNY